MGNMARRKGRAGQTVFAALLRARYWTVVDTSAGQAVEDVFAIDPDGAQWSVEVKNCRDITQAHMRQARAQAERRRARWMLASHIHGTSCWLVQRQGELPQVWAG